MQTHTKIMTLSRIACFIALQCALPAGNTAFAREYFNPALLGIDGPGKELTDLSAFEEGIGQMPGTYRVDVIVNKSSAGVHDVNFVMQKIRQATPLCSPASALTRCASSVFVPTRFQILLVTATALTWRRSRRPAPSSPLNASSYGCLFRRPP